MTNADDPLAVALFSEMFMADQLARARLSKALPKGTHDWQKFITPEELFKLIEGAGLDPVDRKGFVFNPIAWSWRVSDRDLSVNYVTASVKR